MAAQRRQWQLGSQGRAAIGDLVVRRQRLWETNYEIETNGHFRSTSEIIWLQERDHRPHFQPTNGGRLLRL